MSKRARDVVPRGRERGRFVSPEAIRRTENPVGLARDVSTIERHDDASILGEYWLPELRIYVRRRVIRLSDRVVLWQGSPSDGSNDSIYAPRKIRRRPLHRNFPDREKVAETILRIIRPNPLSAASTTMKPLNSIRPEYVARRFPNVPERYDRKIDVYLGRTPVFPV